MGLLEKWGHRVTVANNGAEAVALSANEAFDLILMDVQMPELDGLDATKVIRQRELSSGGHLPIIAMTAHAMKGDRELCLEAGMDDYLMKPIRAEELFQTLERLQGAAVAGVAAPVSEIDRSVAMLSDNVNWDAARLAVNHDETLLLQVIEAFLEEGPQLVLTMREAVKSEDSKRFQRAAHTLKSGLRMFGLESLADVVETLELSAKKGVIPDETVTTLDPVFDRVHAVFARISADATRLNGSR